MPASRPVAVSQPDLLCPECEYNLAGSVSDRCPWCGWTIEVQELLASNLNRHSGMRLSVAATAMLVGLASLVALAGLYAQSRNLGWRDGLALVSVFAVAMGHLSLGVMALRNHHRWPMKPGEFAGVLRVVAWGSIVAGVVAATPLLNAAPNPLVVKGVQVNGVLEFVMTATFFALPGAMLLILRLVAYRSTGRRLWMTADSPVGSVPFVVDVGRSYRADQILTSWSTNPRPTSPAVEELIARTWEAETALAGGEGSRLFNGAVARLIGAEMAPDRLQLRLGQTTFREFLATNLFHSAEVTRQDAACRADALGISGLVLTRDGYVALGRRSRKVLFHAECLHTFGGLLEEQDRSQDGYDVIRSLLRELREELGLLETELGRILVTGLVRDKSIMQPELIFDVPCSLSRAELEARPGRVGDDEHTAIEFFCDDPDSIAGCLKSAKALTPVAQAALLLHGRHHWKDAWYEQTCLRTFGRLP